MTIGEWKTPKNTPESQGLLTRRVENSKKHSRMSGTEGLLTRRVENSKKHSRKSGTPD
jgi:hypothetical protein